MPGILGHFQVDASGGLTTPLLPADGTDPAAHGIGEPERDARLALQDRVAEVLARNRLVGPGEAPPPRPDSERARAAADGQAAFDELAQGEGRVARPRGSAVPAQADGGAPVERAPPADGAAEVDGDAPRRTVVSTFQSELEPLRFSRLDADHLVLFRNAWRAGRRYVQGALIDRAAFLETAIGARFADAGLAPGTRLAVSSGAERLAVLALPGASGSGRGLAGGPLFTARLSPPLAAIELAFLAGELPRGAAHRVLVWTTVVLFGVLSGGFIVMYRFGLKQIELARQQRNFVSAVSHELKTPLTSIRMYGEMLKSGWAGEDKKQAYYDFIFAEGERLSRLIDNVLLLARLDRHGPPAVLETVTVAEAVDTLRSKLLTQVERAGLTLTLEVDPSLAPARIEIDPDALAQVFINLIDNAIKFAHEAERREIVLSARPSGDGRAVFRVRDFGPGLPPGELERLFRLFYRPDDPRTRATPGTGMGLALVRQLVGAMNGKVDVRNCEPGAEFRLSFAIVRA